MSHVVARCRCCIRCTAPCAGARSGGACEDAVCTCEPPRAFTAGEREFIEYVHGIFEAQLHEQQELLIGRTIKMLRRIADALAEGADPKVVALISTAAADALASPKEQRQEILSRATASIEVLERREPT